MGKAYKSRHHIGSRRAAERVITYNEAIWPSTGLMAVQSITKTSSERPLKRKLSENNCYGFHKPAKIPKLNGTVSSGKTTSFKPRGSGAYEQQSDNQSHKLCSKNKQSKPKNKSNVQKKTNVKEPCSKRTSKQKAEPESSSVNCKKKKVTFNQEALPMYVRRVASLNAQAKVNVLYDQKTCKKDQSKPREKVIKKSSPNVSEEDIPLANLCRIKSQMIGQLSSKVNKKASVNVRLKKDKTVPQKQNKKSGNIKLTKSIEKEKDMKRHRNSSDKMKAEGARKMKVAKKPEKVITKNKSEIWRHSRRMASLNASAILEASYEPTPHTKVQKNPKRCISDKTEKISKSKRKTSEGRKSDIKSPDQKVNSEINVQNDEEEKYAGAISMNCEVNIRETDVLEALKKDLSERNAASNTMTSLKPLPEPKMATGQMMMICQNRPLMQSDNTIHWTNLELLQQSSGLDGSPIKAEMMGPPPAQMTQSMHPQGPITMASYQCTPVPPIVPSSHFQSYTVGGLGSITNLPMMPSYRSAFSVPGYSSIYQAGFYQPAGPLIQAMSDQSSGPLLQTMSDGCLIQHPIAIRPMPQTHHIEQNPQQPCVTEAKSAKYPISSKSKKDPPKSEPKSLSRSNKGGKAAPQSVPAKELTKKSLKADKQKEKDKKSPKDQESSKKTKSVTDVKKKTIRNRSPWTWQGESVMKKIPSLADEQVIERKCYLAMRHKSGDVINVRDCVLICSGPRKTDLPYVAKIAALWENPQDNDKMMSVLWYYRPEHTETGRLPHHINQELFTSKHWDEISVACIEDKAHVLTACEYARYKAEQRRQELGQPQRLCVVPELDAPYPRSGRLPDEDTDSETVYLCRSVYDFRQKRLLKNPS